MKGAVEWVLTQNNDLCSMEQFCYIDPFYFIQLPLINLICSTPRPVEVATGSDVMGHRTVANYTKLSAESCTDCVHLIEQPVRWQSKKEFSMFFRLDLDPHSFCENSRKSFCGPNVGQSCPISHQSVHSTLLFGWYGVANYVEFSLKSVVPEGDSYISVQITRISRRDEGKDLCRDMPIASMTSGRVTFYCKGRDYCCTVRCTVSKSASYLFLAKYWMESRNLLPVWQRSPMQRIKKQLKASPILRPPEVFGIHPWYNTHVQTSVLYMEGGRTERSNAVWNTRVQQTSVLYMEGGRTERSNAVWNIRVQQTSVLYMEGGRTERSNAVWNIRVQQTSVLYMEGGRTERSNAVWNIRVQTDRCIVHGRPWPRSLTSNMQHLVTFDFASLRHDINIRSPTNL
ncbi:hypothetical protein J6590_020529 [Homalodisca vitripennis]|nr:hypothetical protein J6590_020529 [Homalodisca vitripennis]